MVVDGRCPGSGRTCNILGAEVADEDAESDYYGCYSSTLMVIEGKRSGGTVRIE